MKKFPWKNLVELDDQNQIWLKYNIPNSGGRVFLIAETGEILAIDPEADQVREILEKKFNE